MAFGDNAVESVAAQLLGGELAHGLQQPEPPAGRAEGDVEHRPLDQRRQAVVDLVRGEAGSSGDGFGGGDVETVH